MTTTTTSMPRDGAVWFVAAAAAAAGAGLSWALLSVRANTKEDGLPSAVGALIRERRSIFPKQYSAKPVPRCVLEEMLEAARWAPSHKITEAWGFVAFESLESREEVGRFLADRYKSGCEASGKEFSEAKFRKKLSNAQKASCIVALLCKRDPQSKQQNPWWEEICSVAMAAQNMLLVAASHKVGAYWSSGGVHEAVDENGPLVRNPSETRRFLDLDENTLCLGWIFVGDYYGTDAVSAKKWPQSRRSDLVDTGRLVWR